MGEKIEVIDGIEYVEIKFEDQLSLQKIREEVGKHMQCIEKPCPSLRSMRLLKLCVFVKT